MGFPGASVQNGGRGVYNPSPNNKLGGTSSDGGDELEIPNVSGSSWVNASDTNYCTPEAAAKGMGCTNVGSLMTSAMARGRSPSRSVPRSTENTKVAVSPDCAGKRWARRSAPSKRAEPMSSTST